ncbi:DsbA family protein [Litoribacillus peritrichatus]|uniref:DsbA family protein n=1 Tax=Litoribacillus peritrichatus TaxID=718191 RepID=A0ABP7MAY0_9GAMM
MTATLYYIHDPMCSWCWGFRLTWDELQNHLPRDLEIQYVLGGLAPDTHQPMPMALRQTIQQHWYRINDLLGTEFNFDFWSFNTPKRSTYPACRAIIAAKVIAKKYNLNLDVGKIMVDAIQRGYYLRAMNPSENDILETLFQEVATELSLPVEAASDFRTVLDSDETHEVLNGQIKLARNLSDAGFPSLVLEWGDQLYPIGIDYRDWQSMQFSISNIINTVRP